MSSPDVQELLERAIAVHGAEQVSQVLNELLRATPGQRVLTIVANAGVHQIPDRYLRGEVYEASRGNWNATSEAALVGELTKLLEALAAKLRAQSWERVYLVPTGHPILALQIKAMVYRILRLNTVDLYYARGTYFDIDIDQRAVALSTGSGT